MSAERFGGSNFRGSGMQVLPVVRVVDGDQRYRLSQRINGVPTVGTLLDLKPKQVDLLIAAGIKTVPEVLAAGRTRLVEIGLSKNTVSNLSESFQARGTPLGD